LKCQRLLLAGVVLVCIVFQAHSQDDSMDPVARQLLESLDAPAGPAAVGSDVAVQNTNTGLPASVRSITGDWQMDLEDGENINLTLSQSGSIVFGCGSLMSSTVSKPATASGSLSGNILRLNVVPADGTKLYALSLDLSGQTLAKTYSIFSAGAATASGTVRRVGYTTYG
jgi:hypothetical protein